MRHRDRGMPWDRDRGVPMRSRALPGRPMVLAPSNLECSVRDLVKDEVKLHEAVTPHLDSSYIRTVVRNRVKDELRKTSGGWTEEHIYRMIQEAVKIELRLEKIELRLEKERDKEKARLPAGHGAAWSRAKDAELWEAVADTIELMACKQNRTTTSIRLRMKKLLINYGR